MDKDRYKEARDVIGIDCIMLTLNAEAHLEETLDTFYREVPIRWLYVIDGHSKDNTISILQKYPRITIKVEKDMTTGKAFELLSRRVQTPWFIWIDVGKIPMKGWYDVMQNHLHEGDMLASLRLNSDGRLDPTIANTTKRPLGGPWIIFKDSMRDYQVDDDYAQRNIDIIIKQAIEQAGGNYHLVRDTYHYCYLPPQKIDKKLLQERILQNSKGIVKYISPYYAQVNAKYLFDDHWMLMMHRLPKQWIRDTNPGWLPLLQQWEHRRLLLAKIKHIVGEILRWLR